MKRRYSYTFSNAARFIHIYDTLIEQIKSRLPIIGLTIPINKIANTGMSIITFQQRIGDGLKYIAEKYPDITSIDLKYNHQDYILLKAMFKTSIESTCLLIGTKQNPIFFSSIQAQLERVGSDGNIISSLKKQVMDFLEDKTRPAIQIPNINTPVSEADKVWLINEVSTGLGIALVWGLEDKSLTLVK